MSSSSRHDKVLGVLDELAPLFVDLETQRQDALKKRAEGIKYTVIAGAVWLLVLMLVVVSTSNFMVGVMIGLFGFGFTALLINMVMVGSGRKDYVRAFKKRVLTEVTKAIQPGLNYSPDRGISKSMFQSVGLVSSRIDRYHSEDLFSGYVGKTEVMFSEVKAERKDTTTDSKGRRQTRWTTVFDGVFFMADFHKDFSTWATVTPDFAERTFGWLGRKLQKLGGSVIRLENPEFEKCFVVKGGDAVAVRYILTPDMQERLLRMRGALDHRMMLAFRDSNVVLLFSNKSNWFEADFFKTSHDLGQLKKFVSEMQSCCAIVEMMNLNTRIWTKE